MNELVQFRDEELGDLIFRRIEESKNPNMITYVLETRDGRFAKTSRLKRYLGGVGKILTLSDERNRKAEIVEMNQAKRALLETLKTAERPPSGTSYTLTPIPGLRLR